MEKIILEEKKRILNEFVNSKEYHPMKFKELVNILQVPRNERQDLKEVLEALQAEGTLTLDDKGKYRAADANTKIGIFSGTQRGFGFVVVEGESQDIFIPENAVRGALNNDKVIVSIKEEQYGKRKEGEIVQIVERANSTLVGTFEKSKNFGFVIADNQKFGKDIFIPKEYTRGAVNGHKVQVEITDYGDRDKNPEGRIIRILGHINDPGVDILSVILANNLPTEFPEEVMTQIESIPEEIDSRDLGGRKDIRHLQTVTIDGEDAKDLDDAITLEKEENIYHLGVHIADVTNYVKEASPLDKEALQRGTSVYLVDRVIPMLPHKLSNGICSLNQGTDRLALSCFMDIDERGNVLGHEIAETVIQIDRRMTYTSVKKILEDRDEEEIRKYEEFVPMFQTMLELADILREKRRKRGSIDFDFPESKIVLDKEGHPLDIKPYERNKATKIIEDFMLIANETVAEDFFWQELPFVYRSHENPDTDRIRQLGVFINNFGYSIRIGQDEIHPKELQKLLVKIEGTPEEALISRLTLRSMKRAKYTTESDGHFGLATKYYCHFTSPIRRYPDLQIHRIIKENLRGALKEKRISHYNKILPEVARQASFTERRADDAEREVEKLKKVEYMSGFIGERFEGVISGITSWGMYVELPNTVEGLVRVTDLKDDYYIYDEINYSMTGEHTHKSYKLGQKVRVEVIATDKLLKTIDFMLVKNDSSEYDDEERADREKDDRENKSRESNNGNGNGRENKGREGKRREGRRRESKSIENNGIEGKRRESKDVESTDRENKGRKNSSREGKNRENKDRVSNGRKNNRKENDVIKNNIRKNDFGKIRGNDNRENGNEESDGRKNNGIDNAAKENDKNNEKKRGEKIAIQKITVRKTIKKTSKKDEKDDKKMKKDDKKDQKMTAGKKRRDI